MWEHIIRCDECLCVWILPANEDNFAYLVIDRDSKEAAVVDGVCVEEIDTLLKNENANLKYILTTHHHVDHSAGDAALRERHPKALDGKSGGELGKAWKFQAIATPVHTMDHLCYYFQNADDDVKPFVFTGDFLMRGGCGYFFEGTPQDFESSVKALYDTCDRERTLMFMGHEYSANMFKFAAAFDPENEHIQQARQKTEALTPATRRSPSTLAEELLTNPFVRAVLRPETIPEVHRKAAGQNPSIPLCGYIREMKNNFKN